MPRRNATRIIAPIALTVVAVVALAACSSSSQGTNSSSGASSSGTTASGTGASTTVQGASASLNAELPAAIRKSGVLKAAIDPSFPVNNYYASDGKTVIGLSPDLVTAVAQVLGLKLQISAVSLATIIPGIAAGRYDMAGMVLLDSSVREQQIDLVDFQRAGQELLVSSGNPAHVTALADTCGHKIAVASGGNPVTLLQAQSAKCTSEGKSAVTIQQFPNVNQALLAVEDNRADATITDFTKSGYEVSHSNSQLELVGAPFAAADAGWGVPKGSSLGKAIKDAIDELITNGTYAKIFAKYQLTKAELPQTVINAAASTSS
jgi:polar amino acid transport system substrate-binding protein